MNVLVLPWNDGPVEAHQARLLKGHMYGRAGIEFL